MKSLILAVLALLVSASAFAQETKVKVDTTSGITMVVATNPMFEPMCERLAGELNLIGETLMVNFSPKVMPFGADKKVGEVWVVSARKKEAKIPGHRLPLALDGLRGPVGRLILRGTCYLEDMNFYSKQDIVFITANQADAAEVAFALRRSVR
jgi:hypothetical protein